MEYKTLPLEICELKFSDDEWYVEGYASVFNSTDKVGDTVLPGAFQKSLDSGHEIKMYYEHLRFMKPGKWATIGEDAKGLKSAGYLTRDHSLAKDVRAELRHGTLEGFSIGFTLPQDGFTKKADGGRILKSINLAEISFVGTPAEPKATVDYFKSALDEIDSIQNMEAFLRESGNYSKSMATALIGHVKQLCRSESEQANAEKLRELQATVELKSLVDKYDLRKLLA